MKHLEIDIRVGGLGDIWMRLVSFYVASIIHPEIAITLVIPSKLLAFATVAFADRLVLVSSPKRPSAIYTNLGVRHVLPSALSGRRFVSPYGRVVIRDWNKWSPKEILNLSIYAVADALGLIYSPPWNSLNHYQGYSEIVAIPYFRKIPYMQFIESLLECCTEIADKLSCAPLSSQFDLPSLAHNQIVVFPSGTGHQYMPLDWAKAFLPNALYAFFYKDPELNIFKSAGLDTICFYIEPGDILAISRAASVVVTTDSFPSHILQYFNSKLIVLLTELPRSRVVSPSFRGVVVEATAPCHPCPHLERRGFPKCKAGYEKCLNWSSDTYSARILSAIDYHLLSSLA